MEKVLNMENNGGKMFLAKPLQPSNDAENPPLMILKKARLTAAELAYLGDAVFELLVREKLLRENTTFRNINRYSKKYVSAMAQSEMYHRIFDALSPDEQAVMKRGRNLHSCSRAKNAGVTEYRHATGLEALFGHLHQNGDTARVQEIFELCVGE
jgi:ribonuclease-3 family protein